MLKICFMGTPNFALESLKALVESNKYEVVLCVMQPDKPVGRKKIITAPPTKQYALEHNIEVYQPDSMRTDEAFETISGANPDLIVTAAYGKILPKRILDIPRLGSINVHASLLPKYRGASPIHYSILNGDERTGVTIMNMDEGMDTGDILVSEAIEIDENIHIDELSDKLAVLGAYLLLNNLDSIIEGKITPIKQDEALVTMTYPIRSDMGLFSFEQDATLIHNKVRALSSWPGAYTLIGESKLKIYATHIVNEDEINALNIDDIESYSNGTILKAKKGDLFIKCGNGVIAIDELQVPGGKRLKAIDCAHNFKVGSKLG